MLCEGATAHMEFTDGRTFHVCFKVVRHGRSEVLVLIQRVRTSKHFVEKEAGHWRNLHALRSISIQPRRVEEASPFPAKRGRLCLPGGLLWPATWNCWGVTGGGGGGVDGVRNQFAICLRFFFLLQLCSGYGNFAFYFSSL